MKQTKSNNDEDDDNKYLHGICGGGRLTFVIVVESDSICGGSVYVMLCAARETSCKQTKYPPTHIVVVSHAPCTPNLMLFRRRRRRRRRGCYFIDFLVVVFQCLW